MATISLFKGQSANNVLGHRVELDAGLLRARGFDVVVADLTRPDLIPPLDHVDLFIGYQGWGHDFRLPDGRLAVHEAGRPFVAVLCDHPIHHAARVQSLPENCCVLTFCRGEIPFLRDTLGVRAEVKFTTCSAAERVSLTPQTRDLGVIFVAHVIAPETFIAQQNLPREITDIIWEHVARATDQPSADPISDYFQNGHQRVLNIAGNQLAATGVGRLIDLAVRHQYRWRYANALRKLPVTFVGNDWIKGPRLPGDRFTALPSVPFEGLPELYARAQIGLNIFSPYYDCHERIGDILAQGTALMSSKSDWLAGQFKTGDEFLPLPDDENDLAALLNDLLDDPDRLAEIGTRGRERAFQVLNDDARIDLYVDCLERDSKQAAHLASGSF